MEDSGLKSRILYCLAFKILLYVQANLPGTQICSNFYSTYLGFITVSQKSKFGGVENTVDL